MDTGLKGKTALITGGSSGIGLGISTVLAEEGVNLAIASRNPDLAVIEQIRTLGVKCIEIPTDVSKEEQVVSMVEKAINELGHIDFYINNAAWTWHQPVTKITSEAWHKTIDTNLSACILACREVGKHMISRGEGSILIIGSTSRLTPSFKEASYRISKMGLYMYMQNLALEMAPYGIRVNMITPGHFKTRLTGNIPEETEEKLKSLIPAKMFGDPRHIGNAAAFLLSDRLSGYTWGSDIIIDGALSIRPLSLFTEDEVRGLNL